MSFSEDVRKKVILRQEGRCAVCGELFEDLEENGMWRKEAHHVVPQLVGGKHVEDNCVFLCHWPAGLAKDFSCHYRVHVEGRTRSGIVAPPKYYEYSHGNPEVFSNKKRHVEWVQRMNKPFFLYEKGNNVI